MNVAELWIASLLLQCLAERSAVKRDTEAVLVEPLREGLGRIRDSGVRIAHRSLHHDCVENRRASSPREALNLLTIIGSPMFRPVNRCRVLHRSWRSILPRC